MLRYNVMLCNCVCTHVRTYVCTGMIIWWWKDGGDFCCLFPVKNFQNPGAFQFKHPNRSTLAPLWMLWVAFFGLEPHFPLFILASGTTSTYKYYLHCDMAPVNNEATIISWSLTLREKTTHESLSMKNTPNIMLIWFCTHSALFTWFHRALVHKVAAFYAEVRLASQKHDQLSQQQMGGGHGAATCVHHPWTCP